MPPDTAVIAAATDDSNSNTTAATAMVHHDYYARDCGRRGRERRGKCENCVFRSHLRRAVPNLPKPSYSTTLYRSCDAYCICTRIVHFSRLGRYITGGCLVLGKLPERPIDMWFPRHYATGYTWLFQSPFQRVPSRVPLLLRPPMQRRDYPGDASHAGLGRAAPSLQKPGSGDCKTTAQGKNDKRYATSEGKPA